MKKVNAQEQLNKWFPEISDKIEVKSLAIFAEAGEDSKNDRQEYCFYNTRLEGELDLKDFDNLEYLSINGDSNEISSKYQKVSKIIFGRYRIKSLILRHCSEVVEIIWPYKQGLGDEKYGVYSEAKNKSVAWEPTPTRELTDLVINDCLGVKIAGSLNPTLGRFPKLERLTISQCLQLTNLEINIQILKKLSNLEELNVNNCPFLVNINEITNYSEKLKKLKEERRRKEKEELENRMREQKKYQEEKEIERKRIENLIKSLPNQIKLKRNELEELVKDYSKRVKLEYIESLLKTQIELTIAIITKEKNKSKLEADLDCYQSWVRGKKELSQEEIDKICQTQSELVKLEESLKEVTELTKQKEKLQEQQLEAQIKHVKI